MTESFEGWRLLGGLGIFLFGMFLLEESIQRLAGRSFKRLIRIYTSSRLKSILTGVVTTAILQSSSAVSLMVLAFVGAGIMAMKNAIGVILGSNVGTTITAWILVVFGFKVSIESYALPLIGIGGLGIIFLGKLKRWSNLSKVVVGFGFLFLGLDFMKASVEGVADGLDSALLGSSSLLLFIAVGIVLTAIMQSSSATIAIVLTTLNAGLFDFSQGAALVIGANVGTTVTVLLGTLGARPIKKRVGYSHLLFNTLTAVIGIALLPVIVWAIDNVIDLGNNVVLGVALFHTIFNILGVIAFFPFVSLFAKLLLRIVPDRKTVVTRFLENAEADVPEAAIESLRLELLFQTESILKFNMDLLGVDHKLVFEEHDLKSGRVDLEDKYNQLKRLHSAIFAFGVKVQHNELEDHESARLSHIMHASRQVMQSAKIMKDIKHNIDDFEHADDAFLNNQFSVFRKRQLTNSLAVLEVMQSEDRPHAEIASEIAATLRNLDSENHRFNDSINDAVAAKRHLGADLSSLILVNRTMAQSTRQILYALQEVLLHEDEIRIFESVTDTQIESDEKKEDD